MGLMIELHSVWTSVIDGDALTLLILIAPYSPQRNIKSKLYQVSQTVEKSVSVNARIFSVRRVVLVFTRSIS